MQPYILVMEDEDALATLLQYNLEKEGYDVVVAADGEEGLVQKERGEGASREALVEQSGENDVRGGGHVEHVGAELSEVGVRGKALVFEDVHVRRAPRRG